MPILYVIVIVVYVVFFFSKTNSKAAGRETDQNRGRARAPERGRPVGVRPSTSVNHYYAGRQGVRVQPSPVLFDEQHYHKEGYDFTTCFSFKDLPPGSDELACLIAANTRHEKKLERMLQVRD